MKITSASIYPLRIPFVTAFTHNLSSREGSDSLVVKVTSDGGVSGYGEGVPRSYVTGETQKSSCRHIGEELLPQILDVDLGEPDQAELIEFVSRLFRDRSTDGQVTWNAARCAVELAVMDCVLRSTGRTMAQALRPVVDSVTYSGVITGGSGSEVEQVAGRCRDAHFKHVKMKVSSEDDAQRVASVRRILGPSVSLRLDANAAFTPKSATRFIAAVEEHDIACIEQPVPRGDPAALAAVRSESSVPIMADESLVTREDARLLIGAGAVDYFNLRLSKCGGLHHTLVIAELARAAGVRIQLGCQVGEAAILSAAGRHLAAHMDGLEFVEGSYGTHLLREDIAKEDIAFGPAGRAGLLSGVGLGITVVEEVLDRYAVDRIFV